MKDRLLRFFRGLSLRQRFLAAPLLALLVCSLLTAAFIYQSERQNALLSRITEQDLKAFNRYAAVFVDLTEQHTALYDLLYSAATTDEAALYDQAKQHLYYVQQAVRELEQALPPPDKITAPGFAALRNEVSASARAYQKGVSAAVGMATVNVAFAPAQLALVSERFTAMSHSIVRLLDSEQEGINSEIGASIRQNEISSTTIAFLGISIAALLFFLSHVLSRILSRSIETQIANLTDLGTQAGARVAVEGGDEVERMTQAIAYFRQSLLELRESERRFGALLQNVELVSVMLDREARITFCNEYLLRLTGWRRDEVIGRNWFERFVAPNTDTSQRAFFAELLANLPAAQHHESEILTRSSERRLIRWNNSLLRSGQGDVIGTASIGEDITERNRAELALVQLRRQNELILDSVEDGIHGIDLGGRIIFENRAAAKALGNSIEGLSGRPAHATIHHSRADGTPYPIEDCPIYATMRDGIVRRVADEVFWRKDGSGFPVEYIAAPMRNARDGITGTVVAFRDITGRREAENRIARLNRVYAVLSGINALIVRVRDRDELFRESCRVAVEHGRFRMAWIGIVDRSVMLIVPAASAGMDEELLAAIRNRLSSSDGEPLGNNMAARAIRGKQVLVSNDAQNDPALVLSRQHIEAGVRSMAMFPLTVSDEAVGVLGLYSAETGYFDEDEVKLLTRLAGDIAYAIDHIGKQERLEYLAYYDVLTGLANRTLLLERLARFMRSAASGGHKLALFLFDLERFKNLNDSLGRRAGDELLRQVAQWLTQNLGDAKLFARIDADHFAIVLPEVTRDGDVSRLLEKAFAAFLEHPFRLNDAVFRIAAKVGAALFPDDGDDADTLFRNAEAALKKAKARGDRYLFYTHTMTEALAGKLTLENQLRQALDNEEFVLHYQPKVSLASGKLTGAEALIRWNDPRTGLVPPGRFIPVLEETGMIYEVGRWALRKAIEDHLRWLAAGLPAVRIAVNVSPLQLRNRGFVAEIGQVTGTDARAAAGLELEITESLILEDIKHNIASLQAIRTLGVTIAIDDFGTGFSSLGYLAKLPVDTLKIDRSFVIGMTAAPEGLALVSTIITLAHSLKLKVVAEGVETEEQSRLLHLLNCDEMQGFLFSKPVPGDIFETRFLAPPPAAVA
jgi:diguanylate cyclase (GGDEF)-like protein/PAS domain S-box-containing protein